MDNQYATVTQQSSQSYTISAGQTTVLKGFLATRVLQGEKAVIVEHPESCPLPGGLIVRSCLVDLPQR